MKYKKIKLIVALVALAALIAVASVLYSRLGDSYKPNSFVTKENNEPIFEGETVTNPLPQDTEGEQTEISESENAENAENENTLAPDFEMLDGDGNSIALSSFRGKPTILNFWASWCPPCKSEMPAFEKAFSEYGNEINFVMLNSTDGSRETVETAKAFIGEMGYTFPVYYDTTSMGAILYGTSSIPMTFLIDSEGNLIGYGAGALSEEALYSGIEMLIGK